MSKINYLKEIRAAFELKGYEVAEDAKIFSQGEIWYRHKASTESLVNAIRLELKPSAKSYSVHVGVLNPIVKNTVFSKFEDVKSIISPSRFNEVFLYYYCWNRFDAGRALKWDFLYLLPDPFNRDAWRSRFDSIFHNFIDKYFLAINDDLGIYRLLLRVDVPFEWSISNPVLRAAEIVVLGKSAGLKKDEIRESLIHVPDLAAVNSPEFNEWSTKINNIIEIYY